MLHRQELAVSAVGPRYTKPGSNGANVNAEKEHCVGRCKIFTTTNLPPLTQAPPRATVIVHGDWPLELNAYNSSQIKFFIQLL